MNVENITNYNVTRKEKNIANYAELNCFQTKVALGIFNIFNSFRGIAKCGGANVSPWRASFHVGEMTCFTVMLGPKCNPLYI